MRRSIARILAFSCIAAGAIAAAYTFWFWRQQTRPGMTHYTRGTEMAAAGRFVDAEREWLRGVEKDPSFPGCRERLGDLYMELRRYAEAATAYGGAAERSPKNGPLFLKLARAEQMLGDTESAAIAAQRAARLMPDDPEVVGLHGMLLAKNKNIPAAMQALQRALALRPGDRRFLLGLVSLEMDTLDMRGAEAYLAPYLKAHPGDAEACYYMAVLYNQKQRTRANLISALDYANRAQRGRPRDYRIYALLGQLYHDIGQPKNALAAYRAGALLAPNDEAILRGLVTVHTRLGDRAKATAAAARLETVSARHDRIEHLRHRLGFNHQDREAGLELARLEEEDGELKAAQAYLVEFVRQAPRDPRPRQALVAFLRRRGQKDLAQQAARPDFVP
uniref:Uncharacterized protein n=1 Tax=uncultured Armatimonadetes bacterium TaxID=157466 RepID=A0A6J4K7D3_9BACT|nr:hypothetical protein AVDCRST_MAG63-4942 [uncultured Armatimonadetes bacterium]